MEGKFNIIPEFDDILFESRNKEYGAYQLRKKYFRVLFGGLLISVVIVCSAVILPFIINPPADRVINSGSRYVQMQMDALEPPKEEIIIPPSPPPPQSEKIQEIVKYVPPEVVDTIVPINKTQITADEALVHSGDSENDLKTQGYGDELLAGEGGPSADEPFFLVEVMPSFRGGDLNKFREWVQKRTNYPQEAQDRRIQGRVFLTFIIEPDGSVTNVTVVRSVDPLIDSEAVKAIQSSPKWSPGLQRGQPVRVRYSMWLSFVI
jgi:protein TonB